MPALHIIIGQNFSAVFLKISFRDETSCKTGKVSLSTAHRKSLRAFDRVRKIVWCPSRMLSRTPFRSKKRSLADFLLCAIHKTSENIRGRSKTFDAVLSTCGLCGPYSVECPLGNLPMVVPLTGTLIDYPKKYFMDDILTLM